MADNYLEKRMEDMRSGKLSGSLHTAARRVSGTVVGASSASLSGLRVLIMDIPEDSKRDVIKLFRSMGCRVAFMGTDIKNGQQLAQLTGARFYPYDISDQNDFENKKQAACSHWNGIDLIISDK